MARAEHQRTWQVTSLASPGSASQPSSTDPGAELRPTFSQRYLESRGLVSRAPIPRGKSKPRGMSQHTVREGGLPIPRKTLSSLARLLNLASRSSQSGQSLPP